MCCVYVSNKTGITDLKCGIAFDGIHSNHLKKLNDFNLKYIKELFNVCIRFSCIPSKMLDGVLKPRIKNKFGGASSSDNYRKVMMSNCIFKLIEYCILPIVMNYLILNPCQFGYIGETRQLLLQHSCFKKLLVGI